MGLPGWFLTRIDAIRVVPLDSVMEEAAVAWANGASVLDVVNTFDVHPYDLGEFVRRRYSGLASPQDILRFGEKDATRRGILASIVSAQDELILAECW